MTVVGRLARSLVSLPERLTVDLPMTTDEPTEHDRTENRSEESADGDVNTDRRAPRADGSGDASDSLSSRAGTSDDQGGETDENSKQEQLDAVLENSAGEDLTSDHGVKISDTDNSLKAGERGPTIMEDFHFREKMAQFDHESIPERVVHARGTGAHGYFQPYEDPDVGDEYDDLEAFVDAIAEHRHWGRSPEEVPA